MAHPGHGPSVETLGYFQPSLRDDGIEILVALDRNVRAPKKVRCARLLFHDLIEQAAVGEVDFMRFLPTAEDLVDGEQFERLELGGMFLSH